MKELIQLAEEKGFRDRFICPKVIPNPENINDYLWMCELQKWLRDDYRIHIMVIPDKTHDIGMLFNCAVKIDAEDYSYDLIIRYKSKIQEFELYEQALQEGLTQALKLI